MTTRVVVLLLALTCFCLTEASILDALSSSYNVRKGEVESSLKQITRYTREVVTQQIEDDEEDDLEARQEELMWCCNIPPDNVKKNESAREREQKEDEKIIKECRTEVTNLLGDEPAPKKKDRIRKEMECFMQCAYQKFQVTDDIGNIGQMGIELLMEKLELNDQITREKIEEICMSRAQGYGKQSDGYTCNPAANNFNHCVYDMMNLYCPDKQKPFSMSCDRHREMLQQRYQP